MTRQTVNTDNAPRAIGPYSQAVRFGDLVFCSGQLGLDPSSGALADGLDAQVRQALRNLDAVLTAAGSALSAVLKTTVFLASMDDFVDVNEIYSSYFGESVPARSAVAVKTLPKKALFEIEAIAATSSDPVRHGRG
ncbi:MAG: Rid family detoxifying hydrolase [Actinobacteria bacterium]|nr:Rid family detoxifying hydrolase [Actinomycetota bacterium]